MSIKEQPTKAMLAAIGLVTSESSQVEDLFRELFCYLINSEFGRVITAGEDLSAISNLCLKVARYNRQITDNQLENLVIICKQLDILRLDRNFVVHARWFKGKLQGDHIGLRSTRAQPGDKGKELEEVKIWGVSDVLGLAKLFEQIATRIETLIRSFELPNYIFPISRVSQAKWDAQLSKLKRKTP